MCRQLERCPAEQDIMRQRHSELRGYISITEAQGASCRHGCASSPYTAAAGSHSQQANKSWQRTPQLSI